MVCNWIKRIVAKAKRKHGMRVAKHDALTAYDAFRADGFDQEDAIMLVQTTVVSRRVSEYASFAQSWVYQERRENGGRRDRYRRSKG